MQRTLLSRTAQSLLRKSNYNTFAVNNILQHCNIVTQQRGYDDDFVQHAENLNHSRQLVLHLYKKILRSMPILLAQYELNGEGLNRVARRNIREQFNTHHDLNDIRIIDILRHKTELEWEESMLMHKTKSHFAYSVFGDPLIAATLSLPHGLPAQQARKQTNYLQGFYQGNTQ